MKQELYAQVLFSTSYENNNIKHYIIDMTCEDGTVHLVGGDVLRGRVEYCYQGAWYSVCASGWDERGEEARVICSSLGYTTFGKYYVQKGRK